jgi:hypothetical protein
MAPTLLAPDGSGAEILAPEAVRPCLDEWVLIVGDALHNLRSALDATVWEFAHPDGAAPRQPKQVSFPVTEDAGRLDDRAKALRPLPLDLLERIRLLQPRASPKPPPRLDRSIVLSSSALSTTRTSTAERSPPFQSPAEYTWWVKDPAWAYRRRRQFRNVRRGAAPSCSP